MAAQKQPTSAEGRAQRLRAQMLLDRHGSGDRSQAERLLEEARMNRAFGMPSYTTEVERMLRQTLD